MTEGRDPIALCTEDDAYAQIAEDLLDGLEREADGTWRMPWHSVEGGRPANAFSGRLFRGQNVVSLWKAARRLGFGTHMWARREQWEKSRGTIRPGEEGTLILVPIFDEAGPAKRWTPRDKKLARRFGPLGGDPAGGEVRQFLGLRKERWYNAAQVEGVRVARPVTPSPCAAAERMIAALNYWGANGGPALEHGGQQAHWRLDVDRITMPIEEAFPDHEGVSGKEYYASTYGHEGVHATGSANRLNRSTLEKYHKDKRVRAREEMVAEIGAAFLCASFGLKTSQRPDHARYVRSWIQVISDKSQRRTYFWAVSQAERACEYILERARPPDGGGQGTLAAAAPQLPAPGDLFRAFLARTTNPPP